MQGLVVKNTGSWYQVKTDDERYVECKIKGNFRLKEIRTTNPIAVGDRVELEINSDGIGMISDVCERRNYIVRRSSNLSKYAHILAANVDAVVLLVTINYPETSTVFIDRFLASAEAYRIPACLVFNKIDLYSDEELEFMHALAELYEYLGYVTFKISALNNDNTDALNAYLKDKITLISGNSGVGKSTFINSMCIGSLAKTGKISDYHKKGMHTTTFSEMFALSNGGLLIDTPGIKGFGTVDMEVAEVGHYFKEIFQFSKDCKFSNCTHIHEPGCAVIEAVNKQFISQSRYKSFLSIIDDCSGGKYR